VTEAPLPSFALKGLVVTMNESATVIDSGVIYIQGGLATDWRRRGSASATRCRIWCESWYMRGHRTDWSSKRCAAGSSSKTLGRNTRSTDHRWSPEFPQVPASGGAPVRDQHHVSWRSWATERKSTRDATHTAANMKQFMRRKAAANSMCGRPGRCRDSAMYSSN
jgi:hypothetical protein